MINLKKEISKEANFILPPIFLFAIAVFFWTLFDSILMYVVPLLIEKRGFSIGLIGLIIGTSSISGALFDFFICKLFKNSDFRRVFLAMFAICLIYPVIIWQANTVWLFLLAMSVWGIYYDMYGFGAFNFVGRHSKKDEHSKNFGIVQIFRSLAAILAPFIAGILIAEAIDWRVFASSWFFLGLSVVSFLLLIFLFKKNKKIEEIVCKIKRRNSFIVEINLWKKIIKTMEPVLFITFFLYFTDAFFWTLGPLYIQSMNFGKFGGLFLTAYLLPVIFIGWLVHGLTKRFGKKKTAIHGILFGSFVLMFFYFTNNQVLSTLTVFVAAIFISAALPAINAAYADYISEAPEVDEEIEGVADFYCNLGYIAGPIAAGIISQFSSIPLAFSVLGVIGFSLAMTLLLIMPKEINIKIAKKDL